MQEENIFKLNCYEIMWTPWGQEEKKKKESIQDDRERQMWMQSQALACWMISYFPAAHKLCA